MYDKNVALRMRTVGLSDTDKFRSHTPDTLRDGGHALPRYVGKTASDTVIERVGPAKLEQTCERSRQTPYSGDATAGMPNNNSSDG